MLPALIKPLNYTESWLFCATIIFKANLKNLSFYKIKLNQYSEHFYQQGLETISSHQKLDRQILKDNQSVIWIESTWYFFYKYFTRLQSEYPTEHRKIIWKALDYDYRNFPDELWKYNCKDSFRLYGIKCKLPSFVVYQEEVNTQLIFFDEKVADICKSYLERKYESIGLDSIVEGEGNIIQVATEIPSLGIKTFFHPEMINDYWMTRINRKVTIGASIIIFIFLGLAYLINLDSQWISSLLVILTWFYLYHLITDLMMQKFNEVNSIFQGLLILVIAFYYFIVS